MDEEYHPSQIRWSRFPNRTPSSVTELWPPYDFSRSSASTKPSSNVRDSRALSSSSSAWATTVSSRSASIHHEPQPAAVIDKGQGFPCTVATKHESMGTKSLRRFVEEEIGVAAIHTGQSEEAIEWFPDFEDEKKERQLGAGRAAVREGCVSAMGQYRRVSPREESESGNAGKLSEGKTRGKRSFSSAMARMLHLETGNGRKEAVVEKVKGIARNMSSSVRRVVVKAVRSI